MTQECQPHWLEQNGEAERVVRSFDPEVEMGAGPAELVVISPRWGRLRRNYPLLASSPQAYGPDAAWRAARKNLLECRDRSVQLALSTYEHRVRITLRVAPEVLANPEFDLHRHCHGLLDRTGAEKQAVALRRERFWIRTLLPDAEGYVLFEFGNTYLVPMTHAAALAESKTLW
jgi:hypothetical protein